MIECCKGVPFLLIKKIVLVLEMLENQEKRVQMIIFREFLTLYCCYSTNTTQNSLLFVGNLSSNLVLRYNSKLFKTIIL